MLWGDLASGKGGLIGALRSESTKSVGDRWTLDTTDATPDVLTYVESASLALRLRDVKAVPVCRPERAFTLPIRRYSGKRETLAIDLTVLDPRGVVAASPAAPSHRQVMLATSTADGILWLLEAPQPGSDAGSHSRLTLLRQIVAILEASRRCELAMPVTVALTKIDRLPVSEMRACLQDPESAVRRMLGDAVFGWLLAAFPRLRCAAFSAAGTVRNAARPVGLTTTLDWFAEEWQREENQVHAAETRARRSARVARVRRRAPVAASLVAAVAIVTFAGAAAARLLGQHEQTWNASAGSVAVASDTSTVAPRVPAATLPESVSLSNAAALFEQGNAIGALREIDRLHPADSSSERRVADSLIAVAAIRGTGDILAASNPATEPLELVVRLTTEAIGRAHPGTAIVAPLSLARAGACIGGHLDCPADQVREDLAWALLLGTPSEQDEARRLRTALGGDTTRVVP